MTETVILAMAREAAAPPAVTRAQRPAIAVLGAGRAGSALAVALVGAGYPLAAVWSRDGEEAARLAARLGAEPAATPLQAISAARITLICVPERAIVPLATQVAATGAALTGRGVVHVSASRGPEALAALRIAGARVGCFHPPQALADPASARLLHGALVAIEADPPLRQELERMGREVGGRPFALPPGSRALYHAAATLAGNAPLALLASATELLVVAGLGTEEAEQGLAALMAGALSNARRVGARSALTGPIARNDAATVALHLEALRSHPEADKLYRALANAAVNLAGEAGREEILHLLNQPPPHTAETPP